jgi:hypothetical protein
MRASVVSRYGIDRYVVGHNFRLIDTFITESAALDCAECVNWLTDHGFSVKGERPDSHNYGGVWVARQYCDGTGRTEDTSSLFLYSDELRDYCKAQGMA